MLSSYERIEDTMRNSSWWLNDNVRDLIITNFDPPWRRVSPIPGYRPSSPPVPAAGLEVYEDVVVIFSIEYFRSPMRELSWLVPQHLSRLQEDFVILTRIVLNMERPGAPRLTDINDGTDHVSVKLKQDQEIFPGWNRISDDYWGRRGYENTNVFFIIMISILPLSTWVASQDPALYLLRKGSKVKSGHLILQKRRDAFRSLQSIIYFEKGNNFLKPALIP